MAFDTQANSINIDSNIDQGVDNQSKRKYAQIICFTLIVIMDLGAWIDFHGVFVELPLMIPLTPEGWTLPSILSLCVCAGNIMPVIVTFLRWYQGKRFSEIPYIYIIISVGVILCCMFAAFWQKTIFLFGRERSLWLIGSVFTISMLDCTSSLVFFDYMKRFRAQYLTAIFLGEGLTAVIPTVLLWIQGIGGEAICVQNSNDTSLQPTFSEPRFSVTIYMFLIASVMVASLIAFLLLRWTNITSLADATEPVVYITTVTYYILLIESSIFQIKLKENVSKTTSDIDENVPMVLVTGSSEPSKVIKNTATKIFIFLLFLNTINSLMLVGILPNLITYSLLPYGQKSFYYSNLLNPLAYPLALLLSIRWPTLSSFWAVIGSIFGCLFGIFIIIIAIQSPCPWWADSLQGSVIMVTVWSLITLIIAYIRITIGNRIKTEWSNEKGLFYFGITLQIGSLVGTIPMYLLINVYDIFIDRKPCEIYCLT